MAEKITGFVQTDTRNKLLGYDCVLAYETAADYLAICAMSSHRKAYYVYSKEELNIDGVVSIVVDSYKHLDIIKKNDILCTSVNQTIVDLLRNDRDDGVIQESISHYYETHNQSFEGLVIPDDVKPIFNDYVDDAIHYYDY